MTTTNRVSTRRLAESSRAIRDLANKQPYLAKHLSFTHHNGLPTIYVTSYWSLLRIIGHFTYRQSAIPLFRGQTTCHRSMRPNLYRNNLPPDIHAYECFLETYRQALKVDTTPEQARSTEPLLQHYGIKTRWLDVVDSVPHAVFFATHRMQRIDKSEEDIKHDWLPSREKYGFIYVLDIGKSDAGTQPDSPFLATRESVEAVDLRVAKPSLALRPHAQHGRLVRALDDRNDLWHIVSAKIAIPARNARAWVSCEALDPYTLFPDKQWDPVYGRLLSSKMNTLLQKERANNRTWGEIQRFVFHG